MFQYAAGLRLARLHGAKLKLDLTFLLDRTTRENITFRDFDLPIFSLPTEIASAAEVQCFRRLAEPRSRGFMEQLDEWWTRRHYYCEPRLDFNSQVLSLPDNTYLEGYFQDERYFVDVVPEIQKSFRFAVDEAKLAPDTRQLANDIRGSNSVCLHVRRGDYVKNPLLTNIYGLCGVDFYARALAELRSRCVMERIFVFSDDVDWCRKNFRDSDGFTVVRNELAGPSAALDFWLMTLCRHFVIGNSSFAWWSAWLCEADSKIICRPDPWFVHPDLRKTQICPDSWLRVPRIEEASK